MGFSVSLSCHNNSTSISSFYSSGSFIASISHRLDLSVFMRGGLAPSSSFLSSSYSPFIFQPFNLSSCSVPPLPLSTFHLRPFFHLTTSPSLPLMSPNLPFLSLSLSHSPCPPLQLKITRREPHLGKCESYLV